MSQDKQQLQKREEAEEAFDERELQFKSLQLRRWALRLDQMHVMYRWISILGTGDELVEVGDVDRLQVSSILCHKVLTY